MTLKNAIRKGDTTSHGGVVLEGLDNLPIMGIPVACKGHMVQCPKCDGTYPIIDGVSSMPIGGRMPAVEGMMTACGAVLIASQSQFKLLQVGNVVTPEQYQASQLQGGQSLVAGNEGNSLLADSQSESKQQSSSARIFTVTAGHNSISDPGASGHGYGEAALATELRNLVVPALIELGHTVKTDGEYDDNGKLTDFNDTLANAMKLIPGSDVAIELHFNAQTLKPGQTDGTAKGVETISLADTKSKTLSQQFSSAIAGVIDSKIRGNNGWIDQSQSARGKLGYVSKGGLILEICFISTKAEIESYIGKKQQVADAIVKVLNDWAIEDEAQKQAALEAEQVAAE